MILKSILVVDDSEADQLLTRMSIERYDSEIEIILAADGQEALDILSAIAKKPDLILLDINMPGMDGHEFLEEYSKESECACVVVMLTSSSFSKDKEKSLAYTFVKKYIDKPLDEVDLKEIAALD